MRLRQAHYGFAAVLMLALPVFANTPPEITNVRASQRTDTKLVDIYYDAADADGDLLKVRIEISDNDGAKYSVPAFSMTGAIGEGVAAGKDKHIVWDAGTDWDGEYSDKMRVKVYAIDAQGFPGLEWGNEVPPGGFLMGQDGGAEGSGPSRHVNIPWSYWLSKYEITCQQYCDFLNAAHAAGKVRREGTESVYSVSGEQVIPYMSGSYYLLRIGDSYGIRWNVNNFEVVGSYTNYPACVTWYGAMMFAHFYGYDLPTEAEWEKAARGPDHDDQDEHLLYSWGNTTSDSYRNEWGLSPVGYFDGNQTPVGPDTVNGYGLYDVCGNVWEWVLSDNSGIESYPQQEDLAASRNITVYGDYRTLRGAEAIFSRCMQVRKTYYSWGSYGFRVTRRHGVDRPLAVCEFVEGFEEWEDGSRYGNVSVKSGTWKQSYGSVVSTPGSAYSGKKFYNFEGWHSLYLPTITNKLVEVRLKVRNLSSSENSIYLYSTKLNSDDYYVIRVSKDTDWTTLSLLPRFDAESYYLYGYCLDIDDIEVFTLPRNNE